MLMRNIKIFVSYRYVLWIPYLYTKIHAKTDVSFQIRVDFLRDCTNAHERSSFLKYFVSYATVADEERG